MANGNGSDIIDDDTGELAAEIVWGKEGPRLVEENKRLREQIRQLRKKLNGKARYFLDDDDDAVIEIVNGADVAPKAIEWLWNGWLAAGKLHLLAGAKGTKKTTIAIDIAARLTVGNWWVDRTRAAARDVLIWSGEDDFDDTLLPRFLAAGGDPKRLHCIKGVTAAGQCRPFDPARDMPRLLDRAQAIKELGLIIVDSIVSAVAGDSHKNAEVRRGLMPVVLVAAEKRCAVLGLTHFTKGTSGRDPIERVTGSLAFAAQPRLVWVTAKPTAKDAKNRLVRAASNIGPDGGGFEFDAIQEPLSDYDFGAQRIVWGDVLEGSARDLLNDVELPADEDDTPRLSGAARFLSTLLAEGSVPVAQIHKDAEEAGHSWATIRRAYDELGVITGKDGFGVGWSWRLPVDIPPGGETEV